MRFERAVRSGNVLLSLTTAFELRPMTLADALRLCLVLVCAGDPRAGTAIVRWHSRYAAQVKPRPDEAQLVLSALPALGGPTQAAAGEALPAIFEPRGLTELQRARDDCLPS